MSNTNSEIRIVVGGPPHSGKTTFTDRLQRACELELYLDIQSMNYDPWDLSLLVIKGKDPRSRLEAIVGISENERQHRKDDPHPDEDLREKVSQFEELSQEHTAVIGDLPGRRDNIEILLGGATHAIILCDEKQPKTMDLWIEEFSNYNIPILAIIDSSLENVEEIIFEESGLIYGVLTNLDRNSREYSPAIIELGTLLKEHLQI